MRVPLWEERRLPAETHRGRRSAESRGGRGALFSLTAPALMSQIYSFLGELISIRPVQLARRKKGAGARV